MKIFNKTIFRWQAPWVKYVIGGFVTLFAVGFINECRGSDVLLNGGYSFENAIAIEATWNPDKRWDVGVGNTNSIFYLTGTRIVHLGDIFYLGLGLAINEKNENLTQAWNFSLQGGFEIKRCRVNFRHFSNAGLTEPNHGENWLLLGCRL